MRAYARLFWLFFVCFVTAGYVLFVLPASGNVGGDEHLGVHGATRRRGVEGQAGKDDPPTEYVPFIQDPDSQNFDPTKLQIGQLYDGSVKAFSTTLKDFKVSQDADLSVLKTYLEKVMPSLPPECNQTMILRKFSLQSRGKMFPVHMRDSWERFYGGISGCDLYEEGSPVVTKLLKEMNTLPITHAALLTSGTQIKLKLTFSNNKRGLFKPLRYNIDYESHPNHFYFSDFERANAEIGAFHLDKVLKMRRTPPTVGRVLNLTTLKEISDHSLQRTFFISPALNLCFVGKCDYYCDTTHAICGRPDTIRGSVQMFMPDEDNVPREHIKSLYRRSYSKRHQTTEWQENHDYCVDKVMNRIPYGSVSRRMLDLVDLHIFDFLQGNLDRHHFEVLNVFEKPAYPVYFDNGRAFGRPNEDFTDILSPLFQCCLIRASTLETLLNYQMGPQKLSEAMRNSLAQDPIAPILSEKNLAALDRRLDIILRVVLRCIEKLGDPARVIRTYYLHPNPREVSVEDSE